MDGANELDRLEPVSDDEQSQRDDEIQGSEDEGEDLVEDQERDYRAMPELDHYDEEGVDDEPAESIDFEDEVARRRAAEEEMEMRDRGRSRARLPAALHGEDDEDDDFGLRRKRYDDEDMDSTAPDEVALNIETVKGRTSEWISTEPVAREIVRRLVRFFKSSSEDMPYQHRLRIMVQDYQSSVTVEYNHLSQFDANLAVFIADAPEQMLALLDQAALKVAMELFPEEAASRELLGRNFEVHVRIANVPMYDSIRTLRNFHLNGLIRITGVVTRRTGVFPQLKLVKWDCGKCGEIMGPFASQGDKEIKPSNCPACSSKGPFSINGADTVYRDYQKLTLQESPGEVPPGRVPRHKEVILLHDLIDCARPGEEISVTGVYKYAYDTGLNLKNSFPVFSTTIEANHISKAEDMMHSALNDEEIQAAIFKLSKDPRIGKRIVKSIAPSIYGHEFIKMALALSLFGGQAKQPSPSHRLRGDINILLLGDPGVAKSQFLKYVEKMASRAVFTTGKGASAVGLTASVHKDPITREWTLEGGALVLADQGICLIDEFDKMDDGDRVSIHEAMEQQSISISKAGIVTSLQARCAVIAAANPIGGRYDASRTLAENVELSDPILSRFDVMCVVRDQVDPVSDARLAEFVVGNHVRSHPSNMDAAAQCRADDPDIIPQELLKHYIAYAKKTCKPQLQAADYDRITSVYAELRREAARTHGMPIAVRHLESIIRMSEAHARMHLREYVTNDDIDVAIRMMVTSFVQSQKYSVHKTLERSFRRYLVDSTDFHQLLLSLLRGLLKEEMRLVRMTGAALREEETYRMSKRALEDEARKHEITNLIEFYKSDLFTKNGFHLSGEYISFKA